MRRLSSGQAAVSGGTFLVRTAGRNAAGFARYSFCKAPTEGRLNDVLRIDAVNGVRTVQLSGVNLQVVNGLNFTDGINGAGNVIIGYNEENRLTDQFYCSVGLGPDEVLAEDAAGCSAVGGVFAPIHKSGSHNLVMGTQNNYSSAGGIVAGKNNTINFRFASVLGGVRNRATGFLSTVLGGHDNLALGNSSTVSGGRRNQAIAGTSSVSGGTENKAVGIFSSVSGGLRNTATANTTSILGGQSHTATDNTGTIPVGP